MSTLDELKHVWATGAPGPAGGQRVEPAQLLAITKARGARQVNRAMHYFWASLMLQLIVYGLLSHVFIRFWGGLGVQALCLGGALLYLPFTIVLLRQFKRIARASPARRAGGASLRAGIQQQYDGLRAFYRFKRGYEYLLIPLSTALGVWLVFRLYVPGGVPQHPTGALLTYLLALLASGWAIQRENRLHFEQPLRQLQDLLAEFSH
ncbi:hypothetical protein [Hymenobacter wooponensis]|uniref:Uncharacterized protein n=1 Tax=Hymenobacter wooponensis TaxID=1525360 RepID=A0A4Z0ME96_9BACT|nr:hypothetical protein [Hymenobacter wooponensis]TGD77677.1 hypothetical protein EU557_23180 [Hymenobacter wooponensis]